MPWDPFTPSPAPVIRQCSGLRLHTPQTARAQRTEGLVYVCGMPLEMGQDRCKSCAHSRRRRADTILRRVLRTDWEIAQAQVLGERAPDPVIETPAIDTRPIMQGPRSLGPGTPREKLQRLLNGG